MDLACSEVLGTGGEAGSENEQGASNNNFRPSAIFRTLSRFGSKQVSADLPKVGLNFYLYVEEFVDKAMDWNENI